LTPPSSVSTVHGSLAFRRCFGITAFAILGLLVGGTPTVEIDIPVIVWSQRTVDLVLVRHTETVRVADPESF
jgi:hypothetical protein